MSPWSVGTARRKPPCRNCEASLDAPLPPEETDLLDVNLPAFDGDEGCVECGHDSATIDDVATTGQGLTRLLGLQNRSLKGIGRDRCGYTVFYRAPTRDEVLLDRFFG